MNFVEGELFERTGPLAEGEYLGCTFKGCNLREADLGNIQLAECVFEECDLSLAKVENTAFRDVKFVKCKVIGVHFDRCNALGVSLAFEDCVLDLCSFYGLKMPGSRFHRCHMHDADLGGCDLSRSAITGCDLSGVIFEGTNLERADLRESYNISLNPEANRIKKAKFSLHALPGLLQKYGIEVE